MYAGSPKHPIFSGSTFGLMSGEKPLFKPQVEGGHEALAGALQQMGLHAEPTAGKYKEPERSFIIHNATVEQMRQLGKMFGQESVVHSQNGQHRLIYTNGEHEGKYHPAQHQLPLEHFEQPPPDFYTTVPGHGHFRINFDWNQLHPVDSVQKAERELSVDEAAWLAKNAVAGLLRSVAPVKHHPHNYEWHDGHTDHHAQADMAGPQLPGLIKHGEPQAHPHMDAPPKNDQAAGVGVSTYKQFALPYGNVQPGGASDLLHYKYQGKLPDIEKLVADHGYKTYYAGGKYGKPDLANKNYNTGHLMVYDPTPASGGDFGHEEYTRGWRQIHELSHALTYPELNKIYGEGKRMGKLGHHRSLNEALRAVHWEWLAAHKQRELSKQIGVHVNDQDFHKELNTVMHDAAHRAVTGKFTEPSGEGFVPHGHKVPLHTALQMVRDAAHQMGLQGLHDTLKKPAPMQKNLPGQPPAAPALHNSVEGFMTGLKALPKGDPSRGKFITAHMHHPAFLSALQAHPQGKSIHSMLTQHLNSAANAGLGVGAKVTMKSEAPVIYSNAEGDHPVADEKTYTPEEARDILMKAAREKVSNFEKEIEALRARELKKALIPTHRHQAHAQASAGVEDVPPGKANPKGVDKVEKKVEKNFGGASSTASPPSMATAAPGPSMAMSEKTASKAEALCKDCGKAHEMNKCGDIKTMKSDLIDAKGKKSDNHTVAGSKLPDDAKPKQINEGTAKDPGSGGIKLPGASLKKNAAPPTAKPPSGKNMGTAVPTSAPKAPAMKMEKAGLPGTPQGQALQHGMIAGSKAAAGAPAAPAALPKSPTPAQHAERAAGFQAAMGGAFQPKPAAPAAPAGGVKLPGAGLGLKSPKAAGVTRSAMGAGPGAQKPAASAGPVMNAARPAAAKPGIFGKLFGKGEVPASKPKEVKFDLKVDTASADKVKQAIKGKK